MWASRRAVVARSWATRAARSRSRARSLRWESEYLHMTRVPSAGGSLGAEDRGGTSFVSRAFAAHGEPHRARRSQRDEDFSAPRRTQRHTLILRAPERDLMSSNDARAKGSREVVKRDFVN